MCFKCQHIVGAQETQVDFNPVVLSNLEDFSKEEAPWTSWIKRSWEVDHAWLSFLFPIARSPLTPGSHDWGQKAAPTTASTTGLVRADAGGSADLWRGPWVVPWCHLERVRTQPHLPPCPSPSFLAYPHPRQLCNVGQVTGPQLSLYTWPPEQSRQELTGPFPSPRSGGDATSLSQWRWNAASESFLTRCPPNSCSRSIRV